MLLVLLQKTMATKHTLWAWLTVLVTYKRTEFCFPKLAEDKKEVMLRFTVQDSSRQIIPAITYASRVMFVNVRKLNSFDDCRLIDVGEARNVWRTKVSRRMQFTTCPGSFTNGKTHASARC